MKVKLRRQGIKASKKKTCECDYVLIKAGKQVFRLHVYQDALWIRKEGAPDELFTIRPSGADEITIR